jgi:chaperone modulatory protein CbpM
MNNEFLTGTLLDEECTVTLDELCRACSATTDWVIELVDEGVIEPRGQEPTYWIFSGPSLQRARTARRLQRDLGVNLAGAALVLDLMQEIEDLRSHLWDMEQRARL